MLSFNRKRQYSRKTQLQEEVNSAKEEEEKLLKLNLPQHSVPLVPVLTSSKKKTGNLKH